MRVLHGCGFRGGLGLKKGAILAWRRGGFQAAENGAATARRQNSVLNQIALLVNKMSASR